MNKQTKIISVLSISAALLAVVNLIPVSTSSAGVTVRERDYQVLTAKSQQGSDALYIVDNRTGLMAVFTWDTSTRMVKVRDVRPVGDAFGD